MLEQAVPCRARILRRFELHNRAARNFRVALRFYGSVSQFQSPVSVEVCDLNHDDGSVSACGQNETATEVVQLVCGPVARIGDTHFSYCTDAERFNEGLSHQSAFAAPS